MDLKGWRLGNVCLPCTIWSTVVSHTHLANLLTLSFKLPSNTFCFSLFGGTTVPGFTAYRREQSHHPSIPEQGAEETSAIRQSKLIKIHLAECEIKCRVQPRDVYTYVTTGFCLHLVSLCMFSERLERRTMSMKGNCDELSSANLLRITL
ncbi:Uncharacterized protein DAT39_017063 [Clarias magur]|uniref:Uncharacterized protein n=1 Tax=Clarias magur TaxID=1594786 RepID=A0A8J4TLY7_CLAMG|nr:Uncharacterized protein DAT39_017063 [Clarias magur]